MTNAMVLEAGAAFAERLGVTEQDSLALSVPLNHIFGISAAAAVLMSPPARAQLSRERGESHLLLPSNDET